MKQSDLINLAPLERRNDLYLALLLGWKVEQHHSGGWALIEPGGKQHGYQSPFSSLLDDCLPEFHFNLNAALQLWPGEWEITRRSDDSIVVRLSHGGQVVGSSSTDKPEFLATVFCRAVFAVIRIGHPLLKYAVPQEKE